MIRFDAPHSVLRSLQLLALACGLARSSPVEGASESRYHLYQILADLEGDKEAAHARGDHQTVRWINQRIGVIREKLQESRKPRKSPARPSKRGRREARALGPTRAEKPPEPSPEPSLDPSPPPPLEPSPRPRVEPSPESSLQVPVPSGTPVTFESDDDEPEYPRGYPPREPDTSGPQPPPRHSSGDVDREAAAVMREAQQLGDE